MTDDDIEELDQLTRRLLKLSATAVEPYSHLIEESIGRLMDAVIAESEEKRKMRLVAIEYKLRLQRERLSVVQRN